VTDAPVSREDTEAFLRLVGDASEHLVLVGGQAVAFWAAYYEDRLGPIEAFAKALLVSRDVDFTADRHAMKKCAARVDGRLREATLDDASPNIGLLTWNHGLKEIRIDFLGATFSATHQELFDTSVPFVLDGEQHFRVMSPQRSFEARVTNLVDASYRTEHALAQLRTSIVCCREFTRDVLHDKGWHDASALIERTFDFCRDKREARSAKNTYGIDPFEAVLHDDPKLPEPSIKERYPRMLTNIIARQT
jgi:hypothetical protein